MNKSGKYLVWTALSVLGAFALGYIALNRGEQINALWIVVASVCVYLIAYRFYGLYIAKKVLAVDPTRMTPAVRHNDGLDYVPTDKKVLFGHHFAAIAGAGPLVGPVLAAQMGYLPGMIWLLAGVVLAGAVQDFMVLFVSTRRDGRSLGELVKEEMGATAGVIALVACFMIMVIILAVLAMIVVKALTHSPWGTYTVAFTIPLAIFMGIYLRYLRPGRIGEVSVIGLVFLIFAIISGGWVAASPTWAPYFDFTGVQLTWMLVGYGFVAAVLPVWLLICTLTAGWQKAFSPDAKIGFLAIANKFQAMIDSGNIPPQYTESQLAQLVFNNRLDAGLTIFFMVVVVVLAVFSIKTALAALKIDKPTANETPYEPMPENVDEIVTQAKGAH
ncbi:TPA: hypothetical protein G8Q73_000163 [Salmonella enterica]|uniref:CstA N-terminal domain-containing protein n=2 Tax=Salmonella enterica TaxID=28901 RepID=A0A754AQ22_SALER|nr:hypothetical protein [Salmonella enterica subsp. enterica serovar Abortusequi]EFQ9517559.1 hypothetical protein [Salmonella enterica]EFR7364413.1 hypothetical protein [Salmonella enterica]QVX71885.1 hypothetical protein AA322_16350 [Salmonella enterica subsp. enterica serovar Abortusequi]HAA0790690.1 hypothetical protein [Salmonella enterica]